MKTLTNHYQADFSNIKYTYPDKAVVIHLCHHGAGYGAKSGLKEGFINAAIHLDSLIDETTPHVGLAEEQLNDHIMGVTMASYFPLKKGIALFGEKAENSHN